MIVLKHLAREFDLDPRKLRQRLRKQFGTNRRWQWHDETDPHLIEVKAFLSKQRGSTATNSLSSSSGNTAIPPISTTPK